MQELEAEEYARKGVNLTPELWLVKLMVGAVDSRCVAKLCRSCLSDLFQSSQHSNACQVLDVQHCAPADQVSACSYDEQD